MAWIKTVSIEKAPENVKRIYATSLRNFGFIPNILKALSLRGNVLAAVLRLFEVIMHGPSSLSRSEREMIATTVSVINHCHY